MLRFRQLLVRLKPIMLEEGLFAVHSGTTINIFLKDLPAMAQFKVPVGFSQHLAQLAAYMRITL